MPKAKSTAIDSVPYKINYDSIELYLVETKDPPAEGSDTATVTTEVRVSFEYTIGVSTYKTSEHVYWPVKSTVKDGVKIDVKSDINFECTKDSINGIVETKAAEEAKLRYIEMEYQRAKAAVQSRADYPYPLRK